MNWMSALANPQAKVLKDFMFQLSPMHWHEHQEILERIAPQLITQTDLEAIAKLFTTIYQEGYNKSTEQNAEQLSKLGIKHEVMVQKTEIVDIPKQSIFNRQN
jgi:hypothetical protein